MQYHTLYALSLAKSALVAFKEESSCLRPDAGKLEREISDAGWNLIFLSPVRERLQIFLQSSDLYDPEEVLDLIEGSELWLEKVSWKFFLCPEFCFLFFFTALIC